MENEAHKSKISNTEWGMVIGAVLILDGLQALLDLIAIGIVANRFIDVLVGLALFLYFYMRGVRFTHMRIILMLAAFVGEQIPGADAFPLWSGYVVYMMFMSKTEERLEKALAKSGVAGQVAVAATQRHLLKKQIAARRATLARGGNGEEKPPVISDTEKKTGTTPPPLPSQQQSPQPQTRNTPGEATPNRVSGAEAEQIKEGRIRGKFNEIKRGVGEEYGRFTKGISSDEAARLSTGYDLRKASKEDLDKLEGDKSGKPAENERERAAPGAVPPVIPQQAPAGAVPPVIEPPKTALEEKPPVIQTGRSQTHPPLPQRKDSPEIHRNKPPLPMRNQPSQTESPMQKQPSRDEQSFAE